jgi:hypothetical protein
LAATTGSYVAQTYDEQGDVITKRAQRDVGKKVVAQLIGSLVAEPGDGLGHPIQAIGQ